MQCGYSCMGYEIADGLGANVLRAERVDQLRDALAGARAADRTTVIHVETDPSGPSPDSPGWWDGPVAEVVALEPTRTARADYEAGQRAQRPALRPARRR